MCSSGPAPQPVEGAGSLCQLEGVLPKLAAVGSVVAVPAPAPGWGNPPGKESPPRFLWTPFLRRKGQLLPSAVRININGLEYGRKTCSPLERPH